MKKLKILSDCKTRIKKPLLTNDKINKELDKLDRERLTIPHFKCKIF